MKLGIIGYGKMGHEVEKIALERGHEIVFTRDNNSDIATLTADYDKADIAIEFSAPESAFDNYLECFKNGLPVVSGTTGWLERKKEILEAIKTEDASLFYAPNFSIGVNLFFKMNEVMAKLMSQQDQYDVEMEEVHHTQKVDKPSGTAIRTAEIILEELKSKDAWALDVKSSEKELLIAVKRENSVPGTHTVSYLSEVDSIELKHTAFSRRGFALGAVMAAEWIIAKPKDKRKGYFEMSDMLQF